MANTTGGEVLARVRTHPKVLFQPFIVQLILLAAHVLSWAWWPESTGIALLDEWGQLALHGLILIAELTYTVLPAMKWWNARFIVTGQRLEAHWGVLYKHAREIPLDRIASIEVERGVLDRIFGCGTIVAYDATLVMSGAQNTQGIRFSDVPRVQHIKELIDNARYGRS